MVIESCTVPPATTRSGPISGNFLSERIPPAVICFETRAGQQLPAEAWNCPCIPQYIVPLFGEN
jgi:hypothetical protein